MTDEDEVEIEGQAPLSLGGVSMVSEKGVSEATARIDKMLHDAEEELRRRGIHDAPQPSDHPEALADMDINLLTNNEVAALYTKYVAYASYIGDELAKIECLEEGAKKMVKETIAELKDRQFAKGVKGPEATVAALMNPVYKELDLEHLKLLFMRNIMKRRYKHYVSQASALSRTVELRKLDFEQTRRDGNIGRIRASVNKAPPTPTGFGPKRNSPGSG